MEEYDEVYQVDKAINLLVACFAIPKILFLSLVEYSSSSASPPSPPYPLLTANMHPRQFISHAGGHL